jgi:hypothetical protein
LVAGPTLSPTSFRLAALPPDPAFDARIARANASFGDWLRRSKHAAARRALIKRHHPPANVLGGYRFPKAPTIDLRPVEDLPVAATQPPARRDFRLRDLGVALHLHHRSLRGRPSR